MRSLLDVNVLLALFDPAQTHYRTARAWFASDQVHGWASCPLTQNGFARIISQPSYPRPVSLLQALSALRAQIERSDHEFWPDDISIADANVFDHSRILGPNQITDVCLLALAVKNSGRLVTFDRGIPLSAVREAESSHIAIL